MSDQNNLSSEKKLGKRFVPKKFTDRISATGEPYPRCQFVGILIGQCDHSTYSDGYCWHHYQSHVCSSKKK